MGKKHGKNYKKRNGRKRFVPACKLLSFNFLIHTQCDEKLRQIIGQNTKTNRRGAIKTKFQMAAPVQKVQNKRTKAGKSNKKANKKKPRKSGKKEDETQIIKSFNPAKEKEIATLYTRVQLRAPFQTINMSKQVYDRGYYGGRRKKRKYKKARKVQRHPFYGQFDIKTVKILEKIVDKNDRFISNVCVLAKKKSFHLLHAMGVNNSHEYLIKVWDRSRYTKWSHFQKGVQSEVRLLRAITQNSGFLQELPCHKFVYWRENVLVLRFIGSINHLPINLDHVSQHSWHFIYEKVLVSMKQLYQQFGYVHGNLNKYNILYHYLNCYFINFMYSVHKSADNAKRLLKEDCDYIFNFFGEKGVLECVNSQEIFNFVVGNELDEIATEAEAGP